MLTLPVLRWGQPYDSLETDEVVHFSTGEPIAKVSQAGGGIIQRDMRRAQRARAVLREFSCDELIETMGKAADLFERETLPLGDGRIVGLEARIDTLGIEAPACLAVSVADPARPRAGKLSTRHRVGDPNLITKTIRGLTAKYRIQASVCGKAQDLGPQKLSEFSPSAHLSLQVEPITP